MIGEFFLLAALAAPPGEGPHQALLDEHRNVCARLSSVDAARDDALTRGWKPVPERQDNSLGRILAEARGQMGETLGNAVVDKAYLFRKDIAGRNIGMMLIDEHVPGSDRLQRTRGCTLYDFGTTEMITEQEAAAWFGRKPHPAPSDDLPVLIWIPGLFGSKSITEIRLEEADRVVDQPRLEISSSIEDWKGKWPY